MKEREPDYEDEKIRITQLNREKPPWPDLDKDPTVIAIDEETEEVFESRVYHPRTDPETFSVLLHMLCQRIGRHLLEIPPQDVAHCATDIIAGTDVKFLAKPRTEDGPITYMLIGISRCSRSLPDRQGLLDEADYRRAVQEFEELCFYNTILSPSAVVTVEEWRPYAEDGPFSRSETGTRWRKPDLESDECSRLLCILYQPLPTIVQI